MSASAHQAENAPVLAPKRGRPTDLERALRRDQILDTALTVFLEHGYGHATIGMLASASRVTKRTIYTYFGGKSDVFVAMVKELAQTVSSDGMSTPDMDTLESLAARIVYRVHSDELVGLHRLVIAESSRFPELAKTLHAEGDSRHIARLAEHLREESGNAAALRAGALFSLLLGEAHRRRLLGLDAAPSRAQALTHARRALEQLGLR